MVEVKVKDDDEVEIEAEEVRLCGEDCVGFSFIPGSGMRCVCVGGQRYRYGTLLG